MILTRRNLLRRASAGALFAAIGRSIRAGIITQSGPKLHTAGNNLLSLPLVQESDELFSFEGEFNSPNTTGGNPSDPYNYDFQYGGSGLSIDEGSMYLSSYTELGPNLGKFTIPSLGGTGTTTIDPTLIPGTFSSSGTGVVCGSLVYDGSIYMTVGIKYDASGDQEKFLVKANLALTSFGAPCAANGDEGQTFCRLYAGQMGHVPAEWQSLLGGPAFILSGCGLSIQSQLCAGFGFSTFNPSAVVPGEPVELTEWLNYPYEHTLMGRTPTNSKGGDDYVSPYDGSIGDAWIPPGSRTFLIFSTHQYGPPGPGHMDPCDLGASGSNEIPVSPDTLPYGRFQITAYDLAEVIANKNAGGNPWDVLPYAFWEFPDWRDMYGDCVAGGIVYKIGFIKRDHVTGKLYMGANFGSLIKYFVFNTSGI